MKNEFFDKEKEVILTDLSDENLEPAPLEASEEILLETGLDSEFLSEETFTNDDIPYVEESSDTEILDEIGEGLLVEDELDEMEIVSEYEYGEEEETEPMVSAEESAEREFGRITELIENKKYAELKVLLGEIPPIDLAEAFSEVEPKYHAVILRLLGKEAAADVFVELDTDTQRVLIESFSDRELAAILEEMYLDDTVDIIEEMPAAVVKRIIKSSSKDDREMINRLLLFDKDTAGAIMTTEYVRLIPEMTVGEALDHIKAVAIDKETIYTCYVTDRKRHLLGIVTAKDMLLNDRDVTLESIMEENVVFSRTSDDKEEVALLFDRYGFLALPVVDSECRLVGIVTVDDAMDVIREETEEDFAKMAGMTPTETTYLKTSAFDFLKARLPWLLLLMFSATVSTAILTIFEDALSAALVLFVPMIMGTGGNSGGQSSVTVIRSLSLGEIEFKDLFRVMRKELTVGILAGVLVGIATFLKVVLIDSLILGNPDVSMLVALAVAVSLALTIIFAKLIGAALPILAKKLGFDPAVMASPFITTLVDAASLLIYFVIAAEVFALRA
jgi:magnesium transporter